MFETTGRKKKPPQKLTADQYKRHKEAVSARQRAAAHLSNDLGQLPPSVNQGLVDECERDLEKFLRTFFPKTFRLPFSNDHRKSIGKAQDSVTSGGLFAWAAPRGTGKTAIAQGTAIWSALYGLRRWVPIIGPDAGHAGRLLKNIKAELRFNDLLADHFPAVCIPIRRLEGKSIKAGGQHVNGKPTRISWGDGKLTMPSIDGSRASGAIMTTAGITGQIRGMSEIASDGGLIRPDFFIADDFQTHESAYSVSQCDSRLSVILSDIKELAAPGVQMAGIVLCTVIRKGDAADQLLDRKLHPEFRGERMKAMYSLPENKDWWAKYAEVLRKGLEEDEDTSKANSLYADEREVADAGAVVAWPERVKDGDVSALQSLMNVSILNPSTFEAEYQNEPKDFSLSDLTELSPAEVARKVNGIPHGIVPLQAVKITIGIDVQKGVLFYVVVAWEDDFTGYIIDYGAWPAQSRRTFLIHQINPTLAQAFPDRPDLEGQIYAGLDSLVNHLVGREWPREGDGIGYAKISRCLIDGNWPEVMDVVYQFCRRSQHSAVLMPSRGAFYGARTRKGITDHQKRPGERLGHEWVIPVATRRETTHVRWDTNAWKTILHSRLTVPVGSRTSLTLFGSNPQEHQMLADHLCAERRNEVKGPEKTVMEWTQSPQRENHLLDCVLMAAVAASVEGVRLKDSHADTKKVIKPRMTLSQMKAAAERR